MPANLTRIVAILKTESFIFLKASEAVKLKGEQFLDYF